MDYIRWQHRQLTQWRIEKREGKTYNRYQGNLKKQVDRIKAQLDKQRGQIDFFKVGVEIRKEKIVEHEETIKDMLKNMKILEVQ